MFQWLREREEVGSFYYYYKIQTLKIIETSHLQIENNEKVGGNYDIMRHKHLLSTVIQKQNKSFSRELYVTYMYI